MNKKKMKDKKTSEFLLDKELPKTIDTTLIVYGKGGHGMSNFVAIVVELLKAGKL